MDLLTRARWLLIRAALLMLVLRGVFVLTLSDARMVDLVVTIAGILWLGRRWLRQYRGRELSLGGELIEVLALAAACWLSPFAARGLMYFGLFFRALYGSARRVFVLFLTYVGGFIAALAISSAERGLVLDSAVVFQVIGFGSVALVMHLFASSLTQQDRAASREETLRRASAALIGAADQAAIEAAADDTARELTADIGVAPIILIFDPGGSSPEAGLIDHSLPGQCRRADLAALPEPVRQQLEAGQSITVGTTTARHLSSTLGLDTTADGASLSPVIVDGALYGAVMTMSPSALPSETRSSLTTLGSLMALALARIALVTELHQRRSNARFGALLRYSSDVMSVLAADGTVREVSPAVEHVFGYHPDDFIGQNAFDYVHPDDTESTLASFATSLEAGAGSRPPVEFRLRHKDGSWRWVESIANNMLDDPTIAGFVVNARDITERKEMESDLRGVQARAAQKKSEARFRSLIQNASDFITILDGNGTMTYVSPAAERLLGYRPEELSGRGAFDLLHADDLPSAQHTLTQLLQHPGQTATLEVRARHRDGTWRWIEGIGTNLLDDPDVGGLVVNSRDVTERKALAEARARAAALAQSDELKSAILAAVSHELRTPLTTIQASVSALLDSSVAWNDEARDQFLRAIDAESQRLGVTLGKLLDLSRLEGGALQARKEWYDVEELVADVTDRLAVRRTGHRLTTNVAPDLPMLCFDYVLIAQVLTNLLENSIKYSPPETAIVVSAHCVGDAVEVAVSDEGPGVPADELGRIFGKFYRTDSNQHVSGTGIGLAISKGLVEAHGGHIWAEQRDGGGLVVRFTLPSNHDAEAT